MSVGGVGRGGKGGRAGGAGGATGPKGPSGAGGGFKVDKSESLVGASREVSTSEVRESEPVLSAQARAIAQQLKNGQIGSKQEATKKLVAEILKEKVKVSSKALTEKIADTLQDDPRLNQALDRIWSKG